MLDLLEGAILIAIKAERFAKARLISMKQFYKGGDTSTEFENFKHKSYVLRNLLQVYLENQDTKMVASFLPLQLCSS